MIGPRLWLLQRATALVMAPFVLVHLGLIIIAVQGGLDASEILARTQGSLGWALFYVAFVLAVAIHAAIGLRVVIAETLRPRRWVLDLMAWIILIVLAVLGLRAVYAVVA
ncbi:MAG: succinate dehydrogenase [Pseudomonadota bacterium]